MTIYDINTIFFVYYFFANITNKKGKIYLYYDSAVLENLIFLQICCQAVPLLVELIQHPEARAVENINPTENAISAVTKILKFNGSACNMDQILPVW